MFGVKDRSGLAEHELSLHFPSASNLPCGPPFITSRRSALGRRVSIKVRGITEFYGQRQMCRISRRSTVHGHVPYGQGSIQRMHQREHFHPKIRAGFRGILLQIRRDRACNPHWTVMPKVIISIYKSDCRLIFESCAFCYKVCGSPVCQKEFLLPKMNALFGATLETPLKSLLERKIKDFLGCASSREYQVVFRASFLLKYQKLGWSSVQNTPCDDAIWKMTVYGC